MLNLNDIKFLNILLFTLQVKKYSLNVTIQQRVLGVGQRQR